MESDEIEIALEELETRLERLRALYEQYFLGFEKIEPAVARKDVERRIYTLRREKIRNTGRRFKLQTIIQRFNTFQQYWQRICREIENGTYRRHVLRAEKRIGPAELLTAAARRRFGVERSAEGGRRGHEERLAEAAPAQEISELDDDATMLDAPADDREPATPAPPPPSPAGVSPGRAPPPIPSAGSPPERPQRPPPAPIRRSPQAPARTARADPLSDQLVRDLHARFNAAGKGLNQPPVALEKMRESLEATRANLQARHGDRRIEFEVIVKGGRPVLKPIVR